MQGRWFHREELCSESAFPFSSILNLVQDPRSLHVNDSGVSLIERICFAFVIDGLTEACFHDDAVRVLIQYCICKFYNASPDL